MTVSSSSIEMSNLMLRSLCEKAKRGLKLAKYSKKTDLIARRKAECAKQGFFAKLFKFEVKIPSDEEIWLWYKTEYEMGWLWSYYHWLHYGDETTDIIKKLLIASYV